MEYFRNNVRDRGKCDMMNQGHIILIGFMGTGKTTISRELHRVTGMEETDLDACISDREGCSIPDIFEKKGESYFRRLETECLNELLAGNPVILSCGGGTPLREENRNAMQGKGTVVWLTASPQTIYDRVKENRDRPLLNGNMNVEYIASLLKQREECYKQAADCIVNTDQKSVSEIAEEIISKLHGKSKKNGIS